MRLAEDDGSFVSSIPFDEARIHAASIYCSDGRYGLQMDEFLQRRLGLPRYDRLALPGGPACLSGNLAVFWEGKSAEQQLQFLCHVHGLERVVLIAHEGCAFYLQHLKISPDRMAAQQAADVQAAQRRITRLSPGVAVEAYFARRSGAAVRLEAMRLP
jgi:carbonic anhydrase-like protein